MSLGTGFGGLARTVCYDLQSIFRIIYTTQRALFFLFSPIPHLQAFEFLFNFISGYSLLPNKIPKAERVAAF